MQSEMTEKRPNSNKESRNPIVRFCANLGPGLITGAADDAPSGIATYSTAGALLGTGQLWTALITWPLMASVQMMCARIGMVTGRGLAGAFHHKLPKPLIMAFATALLLANTINIGADLRGMADAAQMLSGFNSHLFVALFGVASALATVFFRYHSIASILKWLALTLFAYVITAFVIGPDGRAVAHDTFIPSLPRGHPAWARRRSCDRYRSENHAQPAKLTFERCLSLRHDVVDVRGFNWNVRVLKRR